MPALNDLGGRLSSEPDWHKMYETNLPLAREIASKVPLIHVTKGELLTLVVSKPPQEITSSVAGRSDRAIEVEDALGLGRCLYFYAGRASKDFGDFALAFSDPSFEDRHTGSATPFDTGGLYRGFILWNLPDRELWRLKEFVDNSRVPLAVWRDGFARFLAAYFASPLDYWSARPKMADPEGILLHPSNSWRSWAFEIRVHEGENIFGRSAWCCTSNFFQKLDSAVTADKEPPLDAYETWLQTFLEREGAICPNGTEEFHEKMEEWVLERING